MYTNAEFNGVGRACGAVHVVYYVVIARSRSTYSCNAPYFTLYRGPLTRRSSMAKLGVAKDVGSIVVKAITVAYDLYKTCLLYTSPSPRDATLSRMPSSA